MAGAAEGRASPPSAASGGGASAAPTARSHGAGAEPLVGLGAEDDGGAQRRQRAEQLLVDGEPHVEQVLEALERGAFAGSAAAPPAAAPGIGCHSQPHLAPTSAQHSGWRSTKAKAGGARRSLQEGRHQHVLGALVEHHAARRPEPPPVGPQRGARARGEQRRQRRRVGEERAQRRVLRVEDGVAVRVHRLQQLALGAARRDHLLEVRVLHPRAGVHVDLPLPRRRLHVPRVERVEAQPRDAGHLAEQRRQRRRARALQPADEEEFVRRAARVGADVRHIGARGRRRGRWWRWWRCRRGGCRGGGRNGGGGGGSRHVYQRRPRRARRLVLQLQGAMEEHEQNDEGAAREQHQREPRGIAARARAAAGRVRRQNRISA